MTDAAGAACGQQAPLNAPPPRLRCRSAREPPSASGFASSGNSLVGFGGRTKAGEMDLEPREPRVSEFVSAQVVNWESTGHAANSQSTSTAHIRRKRPDVVLKTAARFSKGVVRWQVSESIRGR